MTTTDVKRQRQSAITRADASTAPEAAADGKPSAEADANAQRPAEPGAVVDVLDATSPVGGAPRKVGTRGAQAALIGLGVVDAQAGTQPSTSTTPGTPGTARRSWRAAVAGALIGLTAVVGGTQSAQAAMLGRDVAPHMLVHRELKASPFNALSVQLKRGAPSGDPPPLPTVLSERDGVTVRLVRDDDGRPTALAVDARNAVRGGLPAILASTSTGMKVTHGSDPGDFYCEHAFFTTTSEALQPGSSILRNARGEVLTGFMHVPSDKWTYNASEPAPAAPIDQAERHGDRREIVGAALRGFFEEARPALTGDAPFRMLLTGYAQWGGVVNNPTGDFVLHRENVDAAMRHAFGDALVGTGMLVDSGLGHDRTRIEYTVRDASTSTGTRGVVVEAARLPVTDAAIDAGPDSLQARIRDFAPHAVMSMGVSGGASAHLAEFHADNGGLRVFDDGSARHDDAVSASMAHPDNYALARAIVRGHTLLQATTPHAPATSVTPGDVVAVTTPASVSTTSTTTTPSTPSSRSD